MTDEPKRDALANPHCKACGGWGFLAFDTRGGRIMCGNCRADFERSVTGQLTAHQIYERAGEIASERYPDGCGSASILADICREAIAGFVLAAEIKVRGGAVAS